jgi:hypothetical protein
VGTCCQGFYTRAQIAAAECKSKKKKQKEKQMAKDSETAAKAARVNAGAQATSHSESDAELGIVSERQVTEITAAGQATSTQAAPDSTSLPSGWTGAKDQAGNEYYYNKELNVTQWSLPAPSRGAVYYSVGWASLSRFLHLEDSGDLFFYKTDA